MSPAGLPSTFFTETPRWHWLIVFYFFLGGLAGGTYFLAVLIDFFGRWEDRRLARLGYLVAFPAVVVCGILLTVDLTRPTRFWHMLIQSETFRPMFKWWSPISFGSWAMLAFGLFTFVSFLAALEPRGRPRWRRLARFRPPGIVGSVWAVIGGLLGMFVAGYTGVLLSVTNRPVWADSPLLGLVFLLSAASTSAALLILLARGRRWTTAGVEALKELDSWVLALEFVALLALVVSLGGIGPRVWLNWWGLVLVVGVFVVGIVVPMLLEWRPRLIAGLGTSAAAILVLVGGFLLRVVTLFSTDRIGGI